MDMHVEPRGEVVVLSPEGKLRLGDGDVALQNAFNDLLESGTTRFVLDLRQVSSLDSACLGEILAGHNLALDAGGRLHVVLPCEGRIHEFFSTTHLDQVFSVYDDDAKAVAAFAS